MNGSEGWSCEHHHRAIIAATAINKSMRLIVRYLLFSKVPVAPLATSAPAVGTHYLCRDEGLSLYL